MNAKSPPALSTRCVHAGETRDAHGSPHTPVYTTTTFAFPSTRALLDVVEGVTPGSLYTRYGLNPTIQSLESKLASLEGAEVALAFSSGMGAEASLFLAHGRKGIVCVGDAYGGTLERIWSTRWRVPPGSGRNQCRDFQVPESLHAALGEDLRLIRSATEHHTTPGGAVQPFNFCLFERPGRFTGPRAAGSRDAGTPRYPTAETLRSRPRR